MSPAEQPNEPDDVELVPLGELLENLARDEEARRAYARKQLDELIRSGD